MLAGFLKRVMGIGILPMLLPVVMHAQCPAGLDFTVDTPQGCPPLQVQFVAHNVPANATIYWDFGLGNGYIPGLDTMNRFYLSPGDYTVRLRVILPTNDTCEVVKPDFIQIGGILNPIFTVDSPFLCDLGQSVTFTDVNYQDTGRHWVIDGTVYLNASRTITHTFNTAGWKSVILQVFDSVGCYTVVSDDSAVYVSSPPGLSFSAPQRMGCRPLLTTFSGSIVKGSSSIASVQWSFPGGSPASYSGTNPPTITYNAPGSYDVTLTVTTQAGCTYSYMQPNYIVVGDTADLSITVSDTSVCQDASVLFSMNNPTPYPGSFSWTLPGATIVADSMPDSLRAQYSVPGTHDVTITFTYNGCSNSRTYSDLISVAANNADFSSANTQDCAPPFTVNFVDASSASSPVSSYLWRFYDKDGTTVLGTATSNVPSWTYTDYGQYDVFLQITQANGCTDTVRKSAFVVIDSIHPVAAVEPPYVCVYDSVTLGDGGSSGLPFSPTDTVYYSWYVMDTAGAVVLDSAIGLVDAPYVFYPPDTGCYDVIFRIESQSGCVGVDTFTDLFCAAVPSVDFSADTTFLCVGTPLHLTAEPTPPEFSYGYSWELLNVDSGTIVTATGASPTVNLTVPGTYNVTLIATAGTCSDTIVKNNYVTVRRLSVSANVTPTLGCPPSMSVNLQAVISAGFALPMTYHWYVVPADASDSAAIASPTNASTTATLYSNDESSFQVILAVTNGEGCYDSLVVSTPIRMGTTAGFTKEKSLLCFGDTLLLQNASNPDVTQLKWDVFPAGQASLLPSDTVSAPQVVFSDSGWYALRLIGENGVGCADTAYDSVYVERVTLDFYSPDTLYSCAPVFVQFYATNVHNVASFTWSFGDGSSPVTTASPMTVHVYQFNSGGQNSGFPVQVIGRSAHNCWDTVTKDQYITVVGPSPRFAMINNVGCEHLEVTFIDSSENVGALFFDYGDGTTIDTAFPASHTYWVQDTTLDYQVFYPLMVASDETGCVITYPNAAVPGDSVVVYIRPRVDFSGGPREGCVPLLTDFVAHTHKATVWRWDMDANGTVDANGDSISFTYIVPDTYAVRLVAYSDYGCADTAMKPDYVVVHPLPVADFKVLDSLLCYNDSLRLQDLSYGTYPLVRWHWDFGDSTTEADTSDNPFPPPYYYGKDGVFSITLVVEDIHGCIDSTVQTNVVTVLDTIPAPPPPLDFASTYNFQYAELGWNPVNTIEYRRYLIQRSDNLGNVSFIDSVSDPTVTHYVDSVPPIDVNTARYCYAIRMRDICGIVGNPGDAHCLIFLTVSPQGTRALRLDWTPYEGWDTTLTYRVYRMEDSAAVMIATTTDTFYVDSGLCDQAYCYYIEALHPAKPFRSLSNIDCDTPFYQRPSEPLELYYVTVTPDDRVEMRWETARQENFIHYQLSWRDTSGAWHDDYATLTASQWTDSTVDPTVASQWYRVRMVDDCRYVNPWSNTGKTIWLQAVVNPNKTITLQWTPYGDWPGGVENYKILRLTANGDYQVLATVDGSTTAYTDSTTDPTRKVDTVLCYKILATERAASPDSVDVSYSNRVCPQVGLLIYIPTAFTPNGDNRNDIFKPSVLYALEGSRDVYRQYEFVVFNRWGKEVFRTSDVRAGWSGLINGKPAPEGLYIYSIKISDVSGIPHHYKGEVILLR